MTDTVTLDWWLAILPEILLLILLAVIVAANSAFSKDKRRIGLITAWGSFLILLVVAALAFLYEPFRMPLGYPEFSDFGDFAGWQQIWGGMIVHGPIAIVFRVMFLIALCLTSLVSVDVPRLQRGEYSMLLITATIGFSLMAMSSDFIMLFVAIETSSISLYLLAGFLSKGQKSPEAGMKYFVYGSFASALMLFGMSMLYGLYGTTNIISVAGTADATLANLQFAEPGALATYNSWVLVAAVMILVGFGFKISAVPFHFWTPDVYEGAPTPVTGFVSTASKAAGFAVLLRVFNSGAVGSADSSNAWWALLVAMCVMTMIVGNLLAIFQTNIKRLLAYSSIGQAGYVLIAVATFDQSSSGAALFYLLMYVLTNIAAFAVIVAVSNATGADEISDFNGLSRRSPYLALAMLFAVLSLGGIPPTAGFFGKFFIFKAAVESGLWVLALVGILNAFISLYYYLNIIKYVYLYRSDDESEIPMSRAATMSVALGTLGVLLLGIVPGAAYNWTLDAASQYFPLP